MKLSQWIAKNDPKRLRVERLNHRKLRIACFGLTPAKRKQLLNLSDAVWLEQFDDSVVVEWEHGERFV